MKKLLLLGGSRYLLPVIKEAKALGLYTITCDYLPDNIAHSYSDEYRNVSIIEKDKVLELAKELKVDGIMSFACDPGVTTAAYVAEKLGLPGCGPYESVEILQNKNRFRKFLKDNGFTVPDFRDYTDVETAVSQAKNFNYPVIVKPVDSAGSKGVSRVDCHDDFESAAVYAMENSIHGGIIVEDFILQQGFSSDSDCFSVDGELRFCSFNSQYFDKNADNPYTPAGFTWPSSMSEAHMAELKAELQRLLKLLNMKTSVYNVECREGTDGKAYIMEVSPRGGGNRLCEMLNYVTGQNLIRNAVKAAVGMPLETLAEPEYNGSWAQVVLHSSKTGKFRGLSIAPELLPYVVEKDLWFNDGDEVEEFTGANKTIGTLVMNFSSREERDRCMADLDSWLKVLVD